MEFVYFLPAVLVLYQILPSAWRRILLLLASYFFYSVHTPWCGLLLLATTLVDWYSALRIDQSTGQKAKRIWLFVSIIANIGVLCAFKYSALVYNTFGILSGVISDTTWNVWDGLIIPAGLSFYTFQSLGYTIDVYRGMRAERDVIQFGLFVSYFPQLVAGPIERYKTFGTQLQHWHRITSENIVAGMQPLLWGFFKKLVVADRLAEFVNPVFAAPENFSAGTLFVVAFLFMIQAYCDFSGYTDIATGVAKWLGKDLVINWRRPFFSKSLHEFWQRNHISMTSWFRDYLYIPLGGNRGGRFNHFRNIFLTFLISGLWHGAGWNFAIWGALHGIVFIIEILLRDKIRLPFLGSIYLLTFHALSLIAFRSSGFTNLSEYYSQFFTGSWNWSLLCIELRTLNDLFPLLLTLLGVLLFVVYEYCEERQILQRALTHPTAALTLQIVITILIFVLGNFNTTEFIYFHF
jgi:D-alanyl-lipoteichoic acid acyltransferase DltB (MBOAT superfamily)